MGWIEWLQGKKTYIIAACMVAYGIGLILQGNADAGWKAIFEALGLSALRAGVTKSGPPPQ